MVDKLKITQASGTAIGACAWSADGPHRSTIGDAHLIERLMMNENLVKKYRQVNEGRRKKLVFQLTRRGFASEINNMLSAMLYCLVHDMEFVLFSRSWSARGNRGWNDYFLPFCREYSNWLFYRSSIFRPKGRTQEISNKIQKIILPNYLNAHDIYEKLQRDEFVSQKFNIPELGIKGDVFQAKKTLLRIIYRHSEEVQRVIRAQDKFLDGIKPYISLHIRRGDKVAERTKEAEAIPLSQYVKQVTDIHPDIKNVFIASDDYSVIKEIREIAPSRWSIITFCKPNATGYDQARFNWEDGNAKKQQMLDLFIDLHFLIESEFYIGTYSSNISRLIALIKGKGACKSLDVDDWHPL